MKTLLTTFLITCATILSAQYVLLDQFNPLYYGLGEANLRLDSMDASSSTSYKMIPVFNQNSKIDKYNLKFNDQFISKGEIFFYYNGNGQPVKAILEITLISNQVEKTQYDFKFDLNNHLIETAITDNGKLSPNKKIFYTYTNGLLTSSVENDYDNNKVNNCTYTYTNNKLTSALIQQKTKVEYTHDQTGNIQKATTYAYSNGNWNYEEEVTYFWESIVSSTKYLNSNAYKIYPNPSYGEINISSNDNLNSVYLFNILGERILTIQGSISQQKELKLSGLKSGIYILKMHLNSGEIVTEKIIVK